MDDNDYPDDTYDEDRNDLTVPCPVCRQPVYEDAPRCSGCGSYLSDADFRQRPSVLAVLLVGMLIVTWLLLYVF